MKKILLALGTIVSIGAPVVTMVSCGTTSEDKTIAFNQVLLDQLNNAAAFGVESGTYVDNLIVENKEVSGLIDLNFTPTKETTMGGITFKANESLNIIYYLTPDEAGTIQEKLSINGHVMNETETDIANIVKSLQDIIVKQHES